MKAGRCIAGLAAALLALLLVPTASTAVDSDLKFAYAFKVKASNGFEIVAFAANERADGRGQIVLLVQRRKESATYAAPAQLTATSLAADLGALGKVDLTLGPSGREKRFRSPCGEGSGSDTYEPPRFTGSFEFHGEGGYVEAASLPTDYMEFFGLLLCSQGGGESSAPDLPGARLGLHERAGDSRLHLLARKNAPDKRSYLEVETHEKRGEIQIARRTSVWMSPGAFRYGRELNTARLAPATPFAGEASFHRDAAPRNRWKGDLTVDLPGYPAYALTGDHPRLSLIHSCWSEHEGGFGC